ncbi:hypothetical protein F4212_16035 [Candidatus Poribacteria bacterium]|nr:hypothetical protein [Candidatus Poribacteria bacterium]
MQYIEETLKTRIKNDNASTFVVIVPNDDVRLKRQRQLIEYHPNRAVANLQVYTIEHLVYRLYSQACPSIHHISPGLQNLLLHEIAGDNTDTYPTFRPIQNKPIPDTTLSLIADTINNLKDQGDTAEDIPVETDLSQFYSNYETRLQDNWIDDKGKHLYLAKHFQQDFFKKSFSHVDLVTIEGFSVLSKSDIKILTKIAEIPDIEMWFRTDCVEENIDLYRNIIDLVSHFRKAEVHIDSTYEREPNKHQHFSENLFRSNTTSNNRIGFTEQIKVLEPANRNEEVEQIAYLIKQHVSSGKCGLSEICVAFYNLGQYQQRIAETFPAFGIPYTLTESIPLMKSEVVKAIFSRLLSQQEPVKNAYFSEDLVKPPSGKVHPTEFQEYVEELLQTGKVLHNLLNPMLEKNREIVEGEVNAYHQFIKIVQELCTVLIKEGNQTYLLDDYIKKLRHIAKHTHYQNRTPSKGETVKIVTLGELRSLEYHTVFLGDFVDGGFPPNYRPDPMLPDKPYRTEEELLHDNRFLFYRVLKSFRERLYLFVPQRENVSELIRSLFLTQLEAVAEIGSEEVANSSLGSIPGFLSTYGNHVWTAENPSKDEFPHGIENMRPLIDHVVSVEKSREETHEHSTYEGVLKEENLSVGSLAALHKLSERTYSVTELETYANCPFQYFVHKVLNPIEKEEDDEDEPSSLEKGSLIHDVLCEFYLKRRDGEDARIGQCSENIFEQAKQQLDEIFHAKSETRRINRSDVSEDNLFWKIEIEKQRTALHKWIDAERSYNLNVNPHYFEVSFGPTNQPGDPELSCFHPVQIGNVNMMGRIDRLDLGSGSYNVIDYKTGSTTIRIQDVLEGRSIQLPIYLQIAKKLLDKKGVTSLEPAAGLYQKTRLGKCTVELGIGVEDYNDIAFRNYNGTAWKKFNKSGQLLNDETFDEILTRVKDYVEYFVVNISNGFFPLITHVDTFQDSAEEGVKPHPPNDPTKPCNYCAYKRICRVGAFAVTYETD